MYTCENCGNEHNGVYGNTLKCKPKHKASKFRFCSVKCARAYSTKLNREITNEKVSIALKKRFANTPKLPKPPKSRYIARTPKEPKPKIPKHCIYCNNEFYVNNRASKKWCSVECSIETKMAERLAEVEKNGYHKNYRMVKKYLLHKYGNVCSICGFSGLWNGKPINMVADHINGRSSDNRVDNMRLVCPMCDTQFRYIQVKK